VKWVVGSSGRLRSYSSVFKFMQSKKKVEATLRRLKFKRAASLKER